MPDATLGYTIDELISDVQTAIGNDSTAFRTYLINKANMIENEICNAHDWTFLHTSGTISYTSGTVTASVPANCVEIEDVIDATNGRKVLRVHARDISKNDPSADTEGSPERYAVWTRSQIILYPKPNISGSLAVKYKKRPALKGTDDYPDVPPEYQHLMFQRIFIEGLQHETDDRYMMEHQAYRGMLLDAIRSDMMRLEGDDRIKWADEEGRAGNAEGTTYDKVVRNWYAS